MTERVMTELEQVVESANELSISDGIKAALIADLGPVAKRLVVYQDQAACLTVSNEDEAQAAVMLCDRIAGDVKLVQGHDILSKIISGLHGLHRKATALREAFVRPAEDARHQIRDKVIAWQETERLKAVELQRKLQAEAEEKARRERERLEKEAAKLKTEEKREAKLEQAAAVIVPTITIEAPKSGLKGVARVWKVKSVDLPAFLAAASTDGNLTGYVTVDANRLARAKAANPALTVAGVEFQQVVR